MNSRRDFLKQAAGLAAGATAGGLPGPLRRALAIDPAPGTTFLDAEHVVILMQENRSFDHCQGTLRGVRGFGDPRALTLPDGLPVWLQTDAAGRTHVPFPLGLTKTKSTWMQSLPHSWPDQTEARRGGHHDRWLTAKAPGRKEYRHLPMTLGYYTREDLPFYHALADAFTVCDQNFCSSLTGTTPNRLYLWSGTIRAEQRPDSPAALRNSDAEYSCEVSWTTFPERLEELGIPWKVYQNELTIPTGLSSAEESWLANFGDNPLEYFTQYGVRYAPAHHAWLKGQVREQERITAGLQQRAKQPPEPDSARAPEGGPEDAAAALAEAGRKLEFFRKEERRWSPEAFAALPAAQQAVHRRAFSVNTGDPDFRRLAPLEYQDAQGATVRMDAPAGDVLHQFREDVRTGQLPAVSWLVAPQHFSDHPESPWYGIWYLAEAFDILTKNPDVWRKTVFILCYDENDGWFDHQPPPVPPDPLRPETGAVSAGLEAAALAEHITAEQEAEWKKRHPRGATATGPIGPGYRVPLVIASPWSRGGAVCSEVFDHTSILQFLEVWLSHRTGKKVREPNIGAWRRAVCGDLTSTFQPWNGEAVPLPAPVPRAAWLGALHQAENRSLPATAPLTDAERETARRRLAALERRPRQEPGLRSSRALPYELSVEAGRTPGGEALTLVFRAGNRRFGPRSAGASFLVHAPPPADGPAPAGKAPEPRAYTAAAGAEISGQWDFAAFPDRRARLEVRGPNGFFRAFLETPGGPRLRVTLAENTPERPRHQLTLTVEADPGVPLKSASAAGGPLILEIRNLQPVAEGSPGQNPESLRAVEPAAAPERVNIAAADEPGSPFRLVRVIGCAPAHGWYDLLLTLAGPASGAFAAPVWQQRLAGRLEDGLPSLSDPALGL